MYIWSVQRTCARRLSDGSVDSVDGRHAVTGAVVTQCRRLSAPAQVPARPHLVVTSIRIRHGAQLMPVSTWTPPFSLGTRHSHDIQYNAECKLLRLVCKTDRRRKLVERNFSLLKKNKRCRSLTPVSENRVRTCDAPRSINSQRVERLLFYKRRLRNAYIAYSIADWLNYGAPVNDVTINTARYDCKPW